MVTRRWTMFAAALSAVLVGLCLNQAPALADVGHPAPPPPKPAPPSSGSSGLPVQATDGGCSLYATSSSFGLSCLTGHGTDQAKTVKEILAGDPSAFCWDELIPADELAAKYGYVENPDAPYYLHSCMEGLDVNSTLYVQPGVHLDQKVIEIARGASDCPRDENKRIAQSLTGLCVMTLTDHQQTVVTATDLADGQIPGITIVTVPSTKVRTNEAVAYVDAGTDGDHATVTPRYRVGGVTMWAAMDSYAILPYGQGVLRQACDGTEQVGPGDTPASKPEACWWTYRLSSAGQAGQVYPFRAEARWTVYYQDGAGTHTLASFVKYDDLHLPVSDIQTVVVN
jgi:hypothetical protein